jgi:hypothetical protein
VLTFQPALARGAGANSAVVHDLYGIRVRTPWPVAGVPATSERWDVEFLEDHGEVLDEAAVHVPPAQRERWAQHAILPDGSRYRRWRDLFDFLVTPDARRIYARTLNRTNQEALLAYLLVDALSYSMIRLGREPLHATAILTDRGAIGFVGDSGYGKSTLGALFVRDGFKLITDDMLVLTHEGDACLAHAGPPRIKLYREIADRIFGDRCHGVPMNPVTDKLIVALSETQATRDASPLTRLYLIQEDRPRRPLRRPWIRTLSPARAFPKILAASAGHYASERDRLARQFAFVSRIVGQIPIKTLAYPRDTENMSRLRDAVLADVERPVN